MVVMKQIVQVCYGDATEDICGVCGGDDSSCSGAALTLGAFDSSGSVEVLYEFGAGVAGFQFDLTGLSLTGGSAGQQKLRT